MGPYSVSYSMAVLYIRDHGGLHFLAKINRAETSYLTIALLCMVRYNLVQKCL